MIYITTPRHDNFQIVSDLKGREMHDELCEFLGRIGVASGQALFYMRQWNEHGRADASKYEEALTAGGVHATSEEIARLFYAKRPDGQEKSKKKPIKVKEIKHDGTNGTGTTDCGPSDN